MSEASGFNLDLFGGRGGVSVAGRRRGQIWRLFDIAASEGHDIRQEAVVRGLLRQCRRGLIKRACIAIPCTNLSIARDRTMKIRSEEEPWGVKDRSGFSVNDHYALDNGNKILVAVFRFIQEFWRSAKFLMSSKIQKPQDCGTLKILSSCVRSDMWLLVRIIFVSMVPLEETNLCFVF